MRSGLYLTNKTVWHLSKNVIPIFGGGITKQGALCSWWEGSVQQERLQAVYKLETFLKLPFKSAPILAIIHADSIHLLY